MIQQRMNRIASTGVQLLSFEETLQGEINRMVLIQAAERDFEPAVLQGIRAAAVERLRTASDPRKEAAGPDKVREQLAYEDYLIQAYLDKKVYTPIQISPGEIRAYYEGNSSAFASPETITVRQILVRESPRSAEETEALARKAFERLGGGEDFADVAAEVSEGPYAGEGGLWPPQRRGELIAAVETRALDLETGETSEPFRTPLGWHIVKLEERREAGVRPFEEAQQEIGETLLEFKRNQAKANLVMDLRRKAVIVIAEGQEQTP
jgi:parvulin-like peptidyl-prolyl isomerase